MYIVTVSQSTQRLLFLIESEVYYCLNEHFTLREHIIPQLKQVCNTESAKALRIPQDDDTLCYIKINTTGIFRGVSYVRIDWRLACIARPTEREVPSLLGTALPTAKDAGTCQAWSIQGH